MEYQKRAQNTLQLLKTIIQNGGDLNEQGRGGTTMERAHLRLASAVAMIKIVCNDAIAAIPGQGEPPVIQTVATTSGILSAQQWHTLSTVLLDPEEFVRERFSLRLHKGLMSLALGQEFLAVLSLGGTFDNSTPIKNKLK